MLNNIAGLLSSGVTAVVGDYESIATTVVGSGGSSAITFSSIPSTYKHLQIRAIARDNSGNSSTNLAVQLNSDTGTNYAWHWLYGDGASATAASGINDTSSFAARITGNGASSNIFGAVVIDILDYANTNKFKTSRALSGEDRNGAGYIWYASNLWRSTSAVNTIKLYSQTGNLVQYSHFALYGIKG